MKWAAVSSIHNQLMKCLSSCLSFVHQQNRQFLLISIFTSCSRLLSCFQLPSDDVIWWRLNHAIKSQELDQSGQYFTLDSTNSSRSDKEIFTSQKSFNLYKLVTPYLLVWKSLTRQNYILHIPNTFTASFW